MKTKGKASEQEIRKLWIRLNALQLAITCHCNGEKVPYMYAKSVPHHAVMLNKDLIKDQVWAGVIEYDGADVIFLGKTEASVWQQMENYLRERWEEDDDGPCPEERGEEFCRLFQEVAYEWFVTSPHLIQELP